MDNVCRTMYKEVVQRYMMRMRVDFDNVLKLTVCADKSKVGRLPTTLTYIYSLDRRIGAMLPPQAGCNSQPARVSKIIDRGHNAVSITWLSSLAHCRTHVYCAFDLVPVSMSLHCLL